MERSSTDDLRFGDIPLNNWNFCTETGDNCAPGLINERKSTPLPCNPPAMTDNNIYNHPNFSKDVYLNQHAFIQPNECITNKEENNSYNAPNGTLGNQNYGNAMLKLDNGQLVRVFYDENNQQLIFPKSGQYELFNNNQGLCDVPIQQCNLYNMNQEFPINNKILIPPTSSVPTNTFRQESMNTQSSIPTSNFLKEVLGNWEPNSSGTYSPFGQNYPLNHPDAPALNVLSNAPSSEPITAQTNKPDNSPKRNENSPLADTSNKKRIVAEVKPMRPSYSDVLAKNTKNNQQSENTKKVKPQNAETKCKPNYKPDKPPTSTKYNEDKQKIDKKLVNTMSSGSESGDFVVDDTERNKKQNKKSKNKRSNMSRKWSSLDDVTNEGETNYNHNKDSQFVFIESNSDKPHKKEKKAEAKSKNAEKNDIESDFKLDDEDDQSQFVLQDGQAETARTKKKKEGRSYHKIPKPPQEKKKPNQTKVKRNKPGYLGLAQNWLEHWIDVSWKALIWFLFLLSDICGMSFHLSFDLCTSVFTQTYISSQAVWRSSKDWLSKISDNKYLLYIDKKFGHTRFGFWRKLKWFKKEAEVESNSDSNKLNTNIPLPATGEEAMKRLLACKGKDPYSILGVSVTCTDEEIKRYYRRQAFLVHPDKNQQPGAEEAFKILQHAFDLIGEPELREAYERRTLESRHVEAAWSELSQLLTQLQDKMKFAANTIRCTNCGRRHKRVLTDRPCYAARYCVQCKIRHSAKEGDIWAESSMMGLLVMYYACMDGAVYQITQWASCQKKNLKQLRPDCHVVQYRIVLGNKAADVNPRTSTGHDPNLEEFLNNLYSKSGVSPNVSSSAKQPPPDSNVDSKKRRNKKPKP